MKVEWWQTLVANAQNLNQVIPEPRIAQFWTAAKSRSFSKLRIDVNNLVLSGYSAMTLLRQVETHTTSWRMRSSLRLQLSTLLPRLKKV